MSTNNEAIKEMVRKKYAEIAGQSREQNASSCCGAGSCCDNEGSAVMAEDYQSLEGYEAGADLGLGCGLPTVFAQIKEGNTVIDLGSGAGNDAFVARRAVGEKGRVIGIDMTNEMIRKARENTEKLGFNNIEFRLGDIEEMPVTSNLADVVLSNCVLNLVPNKHKVFSEIFRVLKPGGHFSISDIVLDGSLPDSIREAAEMYAGCVAGAIQKSDYLDIIKEAGFINIEIRKEKKINLPDSILLQWLNREELERFKQQGSQILSLTLFAEKPAKDDRNCCEPGSGCC